MRSVVADKIEKRCVHAAGLCRSTRGDPPRKSSSLIRAAEYFRPLHKFKGVDSAQKIETGLVGSDKGNMSAAYSLSSDSVPENMILPCSVSLPPLYKVCAGDKHRRCIHGRSWPSDARFVSTMAQLL